MIELHIAWLDRATDGAALWKSGVQAKGKCPSPANRPEVGSSPTNPPRADRLRSRRADRKSRRSGPAGPSSESRRGQLNEIAGDEPRGQAQLPEQLDQQPGAVAAGSARKQRFFRALHARVEPNGVTHFIPHALIDFDQKFHAAPPGAGETLAASSANRRARRLAGQVGTQLLGQRRRRR